MKLWTVEIHNTKLRSRKRKFWFSSEKSQERYQNQRNLAKNILKTNESELCGYSICVFLSVFVSVCMYTVVWKYLVGTFSVKHKNKEQEESDETYKRNIFRYILFNFCVYNIFIKKLWHFHDPVKNYTDFVGVG